MRKGRFLNQKLGKRVSRQFDLLKSQLAAQEDRLPRASSRKKGYSRERKSGRAV